MKSDSLSLEGLSNLAQIDLAMRMVQGNSGRRVRIVCLDWQEPPFRQLISRFPDNLWSEILGNTDTIICLGCSSDPVTAKFISDRSGQVTIYADTVMKQRNIFTPSLLQPNYRHSEGTRRKKPRKEEVGKEEMQLRIDEYFWEPAAGGRQPQKGPVH